MSRPDAGARAALQNAVTEARKWGRTLVLIRGALPLRGDLISQCRIERTRQMRIARRHRCALACSALDTTGK